MILIILQLQILFVCYNQALYFPSLYERQINEEPTNVCLTPGCVKAATNIRNNLDENIDPCEDFYQFACGGWLKNHEIPDDKPEVSIVSGAEDALNSKLKVLLDEPITGKEPDYVKLIKTLYSSCLDLSAIDTLKGEPLKKILDAVGGWPAVLGDGWDESKFDWIGTLIKFRDMGFNHNILMRLSVITDPKNNTNHILTLGQPTFGMPDRSYFSRGFNDNATLAYFDYMVKAAVKLGADKETALRELENSYKFEVQIANLTLPSNTIRNMDQLYNKFTLKQLQDTYPEIRWMKYFNGLLKFGITEDEPVIVTVPSYISNFTKTIGKINKRTVANYLVWRMVQESAPLLSEDWRDISHDYTTALTGKPQQESRWEKCMAKLSNSLAAALGAHYVKNYFKEDSKDMAMEMVQYIHNEFLKVIQNIDWMESDTKDKAMEKAKSIKSNIGYPKELLDDTLVSELYPNLTFEGNSYFENVLKLKKFATDSSYNKLRTSVAKGDWKNYVRAAMMDAYYNPAENIIVFPAGVLQDVFFSRDRPNYLNFGAIGIIIGHEIVHGFDDTGKQFDKDGNVKNWWDAVTNERFKEKKQCIIDQYNNFTLPEVGLQVNGINTQGENIADNGAIKEAYSAYNSWVADNGPEGSLPELKYTPQQLFWISAANVWCAKYRPEFMKLSVFTEVHTPPRFRVIGPFSNAPQFSKDFNCPAGSRMNPENKCQIW